MKRLLLFLIFVSMSFATYVQLPATVVTINNGGSIGVSVNGIISANYFVGDGSRLTGVSGSATNAVTANYSGNVTLNGTVVISGNLSNMTIRQYGEAVYAAGSVAGNQSINLANGSYQSFTLGSSGLTFTMPAANALGASNGWNLTLMLTSGATNQTVVWSGVDVWLNQDGGLSSASGSRNVYVIFSDGVTRYGLQTTLPNGNLNVPGSVSANSMTVAGTVTASTFVGSLTGTATNALVATNATTAGNAVSLNSQSPSYYLNASNINAGTLGLAYIPTSIVTNNYRAGGVSINGTISANYFVGDGSRLVGASQANAVTTNYSGNVTFNGTVVISGNLSNMTLRQYGEVAYAGGSVAGNQSINLTNGTYQSFTLGASGLTFTMPAANVLGSGTGWNFTLMLTSGATNQTVVWSGVEVWLNQDNGLSSASGSRNVYVFYSDGVTRYGLQTTMPNGNLNLPGTVSASSMVIAGTVTASTFVGSMTSGTASTALVAINATTAGNAISLNSQSPSYYLNASNINAGMLGLAYIPTSIVTNNYRAGGVSINGTISANYFVGDGSRLVGAVQANAVTPNYAGNVTFNGNVSISGNISNMTIRQYGEAVYAAGSVAGNQSINLANGSFQSYTLGSSGLTFTMPAANVLGSGNGWNLTLMLTSGGTNQTIVWSGVDVWLNQDNGLSSASGSRNVYVVFSDGVTRYGLQTTLPNGNLSVPGTVSANAMGITNTVNAMSFVANGTTLSVPDYVFEANYSLMPLNELRDYVAKHKHLPKVDSASDVRRTGLDIPKMNLSLLEKVEELTLYMFSFDERIRKLEARKKGI